MRRGFTAQHPLPIDWLGFMPPGFDPGVKARSVLLLAPRSPRKDGLGGECVAAMVIQAKSASMKKPRRFSPAGLDPFAHQT